MNTIRIFKILYRVFIGLFIIGILFRVQHWPFGMSIMQLGIIGFAFSFVIYTSLKLEKSYVDRIAIVAVPLWCFYYFMRLSHLPYHTTLGGVFALSGIMNAAYQVFMHYLSERKGGVQSIDWDQLLYTGGAACIVIGVFLKIVHWPFAYPSLLAGLCLMTVSFLLGMFAKGKE